MTRTQDSPEEEAEVVASQNLNPETRKRIERAAIEVFSGNDFHRANIRLVASKAGVSLGTIYKHYGDKEKLVFTIIDNFLTELADRMIDHLKGMEDLKEKIRKIFWVQLDYYERHPDFGRILFLTIPYNEWISDETFRQPRMINALLDVIRKGQKDGILNDKVRAGVLIDFVWGLIHRSFTMWIYRGQKESLTANSNVLFEMLWRSISKPYEKG
jgi:AcrR family transcriptional regulator